jgi:hypothetical protein
MNQQVFQLISINNLLRFLIRVDILQVIYPSEHSVVPSYISVGQITQTIIFSTDCFALQTSWIIYCGVSNNEDLRYKIRNINDDKVGHFHRLIC